MKTSKALNLIGNTFGFLTVVARSSDHAPKVYWICQCACGNTVTTRADRLTSGRNISCGCAPQGLFKREVHSSVLISTYRQRARKKGLSFTLSRVQFENIITQSCEYCGKENSKGIDRVDNTRGYELDNCVPCCGVCNTLKSDHNYQELVALRERLDRMIQRTNGI